MKISSPYSFRDFSKGIYRKAAVSEALVPENSVSHAMNVNFDTIIGKGVVRPGTTLVGTTSVALNKTPLGLAEFVSSGTTIGNLVSVFSGASNGQIYVTTTVGGLTSWAAAASMATTLSNTANNRFAMIGNRIHRVNGAQAMTSSSDGSSWNTTNCLTVAIPSLIFRSKSRILAAGDSSFRDRVYFSSVISPNAATTITWNNDNTTGDWIDINPDDGSNVTGFAEVTGFVLVFKGKGMYRLNVISKTVDTDNIYNFGAPSQEAIVNCQGLVYFFSGLDIRRTDGSIPEQISRLGVQDWIDAIPQANWNNVVAGTDEINVYFSIGNVTMFANTDDEMNYSNVVLKFSPRDQTWSVHAYAQQPRFYTKYTTAANGRRMISSDTGGNVQFVNVGTTDNGAPIFYTLETQELEFGDRTHVKKISDQIIVLTKNGQNGTFSVKEDDGTFKALKGDVTQRVNKMKEVNLEGNYFTFKWSGDSAGTAPVLEGFVVETVTDVGTE